jgi:hypothetical protein
MAAHPTTASIALVTCRRIVGMIAEDAKAANIWGRNASPATSGLSPLTPCRYWVMKKAKLSSVALNRKRAA